MRKGSIFVRAYLFYALMLTLIYLVICVYAFLLRSLPEVFRFDIPGLNLPVGAKTLPAHASTGASFDAIGGPLDAADGGPGAALPLLIALAVVGLVPNVPALHRIEEWIRAKAHSLYGIPTHLIESGLRLRSEPWLDPDRSDGLLISPEDWQLIDDVHHVAQRDGLGERSAFRQNVLKILALRSWVLRNGALPPDPRIRQDYHDVEIEVQYQIRSLLNHLDSFRSMRPAASPGQASDRKEEWAAIVTEADAPCADICVLLALYSERDAFAAETREADTCHAQMIDDPVEAERHQAIDSFVRALTRVSLAANRDSFGMTVFFRLAGCIVIAAAILDYVLGDTRVA